MTMYLFKNTGSKHFASCILVAFTSCYQLRLGEVRPLSLDKAVFTPAIVLLSKQTSCKSVTQTCGEPRTHGGSGRGAPAGFSLSFEFGMCWSPLLQVSLSSLLDADPAGELPSGTVSSQRTLRGAAVQSRKQGGLVGGGVVAREMGPSVPPPSFPLCPSL